MLRICVAVSMFALAACGPVVGELDGGSSSTTHSDGGDGRPGTTGFTTTGTTPTTSSTTSATSSTTSVDESSSTTSTSSAESLDSFSFLDSFGESGAVSIECDVWAQDCPEHEKCMPWSNDGTATWNATRCSPIADEPHPPGDTCLVEGSGYSGIDDCAARSMCWGVELGTTNGTCYAQCGGSEAAPECEDGRACWVGYDGTISLCVSICDPLAPACADGETCVLLSGTPFVARCIPEDLVTGIDYGAPCENAVFECGEGLVCGAADHVPGCAGNCCTALCDVSMPADCPDAASGQQCWPLFGDMPPPRFAELGACLDKG